MTYDRFKFNDPSGKTEQLKDLDYYTGRMGLIDMDRYHRRGGARPYQNDEMSMIDNMQNEIIRLEGGGKPSNLPEGWEWDEEEGKWGMPLQQGGPGLLGKASIGGMGTAASLMQNPKLQGLLKFLGNPGE